MRLLLLFICFIVISPVFGQIDPLYAQYLNNPLVINPAYSGLNNNLNASITFRKQWAGFEGSPSTINASAHTSVRNNKMGLGLLVVQDKNGNTKNSEVQAAYAYRLDFGKRILSFGLQAGIINFRVDNNELNLFDPNDPTFIQNQNVTKPSFGAGIILNDERFFLGFSIPRMLKVRDNYEEFQTDLYNQHFYGAAAYIFFLSERVRLKPSVLVKGLKGAPLSLDGNLSVNLDEKYTAGVFTRNLNTYGMLLQLRFAKSFRFGYTFEVPANNSVGTRFTTHEISLGLNMAVFKSQEDVVTNF